MLAGLLKNGAAVLEVPAVFKLLSIELLCDVTVPILGMYP